jgi:threonine dehydrogenase-like Zn-dependent dehydrogenase
MKALVWHGTADIRCESVPDPRIEHERDAIIKVTSCDDGRGCRGRSGAKSALNVGDRVVIPFTIICGECEQCRRGNFSVCETTNRNKDLADKAFGHSTAGLFGYTHLTGGYPGGQAEYLRVPFADATHIKVPHGIPDEKLLFLSDIFPTGWAGRRAMRHPAHRHRRDLGLRSGGANGYQKRGVAGRKAGDRH